MNIPPHAPYVSVLMPAYNAAATIDAALDSALRQQGVTLEVVVVDDGSQDDTVARARAHGPCVRVVSQANAGPQAARNRALAEARGQYVAFLDSDDQWLPGKLAAQCRALGRNTSAAAVFTGWHFWHPEANGSFVAPAALVHSVVTDDIDRALSGWLYTRLLLDVCMLTTTVMVRRETLQRLGGFDPDLRVGEDYDLWLRLSREGPIIKLASVGALYRVAPGSTSRRPYVRNWELEVVQRALSRWGGTGPDGAQVDTQALQRRLQRLELDHAGTHLLQGDARLALQGFGRLLRNEPTRPRWWFKTAQALLKTGVQRLTNAPQVR
ncbi:glycosyltransferase family 2 protein [Rubrivivax albus]|uniref:glycosyltransferase family 2 protein n=1 Tax=Rubrivivax albus TaxID=2499835 RepID=UPI0013053C41|nr:glycosyltransferase [Rubrivivax albus]